ncbi:protein of unknown function [Singulisphaera sp. GP187]|uniref:transglutaminase TgpA family protein n=1 Tax=Singulisphaera sp. GP187 TaxID=1882752 RepID=UPI00092C5A2B|nr:DUF3488 and transglutaminase-like domain-containing protein [Singulisphaera sp. GP187]SIN91700.1 protein of unknown function [Singulisphaera sp. GP187]
MIFTTLYRTSFYLMLTLATLTMSVDVTDNNFSILFPVMVALSGFLAVMTVDRNPALGLPRPAANGLAMVSIGLVLLEYLIDPDSLLRVLAHFLVYLQLIKMFLPKTPEDDWFLVLLGLTQVLVGVFISQSDRVGLLMFSWAFLTLWVLSLFSLHRDSLRYRSIASPVFSTTPSEPRDSLRSGSSAVPILQASTASPSDEAYPGLLDLPFVLSGIRVTALTLALGGVIFLAMPRRGTTTRMSRGSEPVAGHLTGFDDEVQLGQLGEILENDSVVMSIELFNEVQQRIKPTDELLWRGVTMSKYQEGRWYREEKGYSPPPNLDRPRTIQQSIKLEVTDSPVLFGLRPINKMVAASRQVSEFNANDGTFTRDALRPGSFDYVVTSDPDSTNPQPGEDPLKEDRRRTLLAVPPDLIAPLRQIALPIIEKIPAEDREAQARALDDYLRISGKFSYTLRMTVVDRKIDPVLDFLINRKEGHCEYYASALALLLRSVDIPARLVNGFKGGDWNELAQVLSVRQKHAHSWVEVYLDSPANSPPKWLTLDPTPANERRDSVNRVGGFGSNFRQFTDFIRYIWVFFVVGYNADRQQRLIYEPIRQLVNEARSGFAMMGQSIRPLLANLLHFKDVGQFISVRGFFVSFTALFLLVMLTRAFLWVVGRILRWFRGTDQDPSSLSAGVVFYRRLTQLLADYGLDRPPAETQHEFARRATVFLTGGGLKTESVADVPRLVVDAFYRVRFGHLTLSPEVLMSIEARLDALEASLRSKDA